MDVGALANAEIAAQGEVQRHQHRQQLGNRQEQRAERERDDDAAEAGGGFHGVGEQNEQAKPQPRIHYCASSTANFFIIRRW